MGEIIKGNFGQTEISENIELDMDKLTSGADEDIASLRMNGLRTRIIDLNPGEYTVFVTQDKPYISTFRKSHDFDKAWAVFSEIAKHIKDGTRSYDELMLILNNKIE